MVKIIAEQVIMLNLWRKNMSKKICYKQLFSFLLLFLITACNDDMNNTANSTNNTATNNHTTSTGSNCHNHNFTDGFSVKHCHLNGGLHGHRYKK